MAPMRECSVTMFSPAGSSGRTWPHVAARGRTGPPLESLHPKRDTRDPKLPAAREISDGDSVNGRKFRVPGCEWPVAPIAPVYCVVLLYTLPLGLIPYDTAWALQKRAAAARISGALPEDLLLLVQHPPVVTLGRSTKPGHLLASAEYLEAQGIQVREVERGGDVTVHEPGQLVAYPIIDLKRHRKDLHWYLRQVEEVIIGALAPHGLSCHRVEGLTGVWHTRVNGSRVKLASIGVHARDWVTWHGVALNVENDLATFDHTVPCGIDGVVMSTVARECVASGVHAPSLAALERDVAHSAARVFGLEAVPFPSAYQSVLDG